MLKELSCVIVDDEVHCTETLKYELEKHCPQVQLLATINNPQHAKQVIENLNPSIVFLDIEMPGMSGFELLNSFEQTPFSVVFVTAYDQYALQAFKFAAVDYILKPVDGIELEQTVSRIQKQIYPALNDSQLKLVLNSLYQMEEKHSKIALNNGNKIEIVTIKDIIRCEADSNYCKIFLNDNRDLYLSKTLKDVEQMLSDQHFIRVHNKHLVNCTHVQNYLKSDGGILTMSDGCEIQVTRYNKKEVISMLLNS